jgi:hypothetical protein
MSGIQINSGKGAHIYSTAADAFDAFQQQQQQFDLTDFQRYQMLSSSLSQTTNCDSPVPRISEPASPAMPHKISHHGGSGRSKILFPLVRKRYVQGSSYLNYGSKKLEQNDCCFFSRERVLAGECRGTGNKQ